MALISPHLNAEVILCSNRYTVSLSPHLHTPFPPSLTSLMVSGDVKHHVNLLTANILTNQFLQVSAAQTLSTTHPQRLSHAEAHIFPTHSLAHPIPSRKRDCRTIRTTPQQKWLQPPSSPPPPPPHTQSGIIPILT